MARIDSIALPFTHAGLDKVVPLYRLDLPKLYTKYVHVEVNKQGYHQVAQEGDFPLPTIMNMGTGVAFEDYKTGPYKQTIATKRGIGFAVARETALADPYGIVQKRGRKMARAMNRAIDADMANHVNLATSSFITPPSGNPLAGTQTLSNGTFSNVITGNPALSVLALEQAVQEMSLQQSQEGDYLMYDGPYTLLVHPNLEMLARRITGVGLLPQTNNNDKNVVASKIKDVVANPWFTSTVAWALVIADEDDNPLQMLDRASFRTEEDFDKTRDLQLAICTQIWARFLNDWRGFNYSAGQ